jgi:hypothetical protein
MRHAAALATLLAALATACGAQDAETRTAAPPATIDTTNATAIDGLSREQIDRRAEPVVPANAERIGIPTVDPDSAPPSQP